MPPKLRLALPKGRITEGVVRLLDASGIAVQSNGRSYRPAVSDEEIEVKYLKPQNIPRLIEIGAHDCGFTGHDWVVESGADLVESLDTGLDPVSLVAAAPEGRVEWLGHPDRPVIAASEYETITTRYLERRGRPWLFIRTFGATEVFPPEDADLILDLVATGATLRENHLTVVDEVLKSSTRFVAAKAALADPRKAEKIDMLRTLMGSVLEARRRVLLEMNVVADRLERVVAALPAMKSPTIQPLYGGAGYAVKAAVPRAGLPGVILRLREAGATDLIAYALEKVIP
ncbi:MAG TPA: ATP phosphoribosyltransferase [Candidatus Polarisedimenticolia bacterium]|nr:ATP phosphoribosyltransferase [Candidatus Polarisedimenticolia bacterium]